MTVDLLLINRFFQHKRAPIAVDGGFVDVFGFF